MKKGRKERRLMKQIYKMKELIYEKYTKLDRKIKTKLVIEKMTQNKHCERVILKVG